MMMPELSLKKVKETAKEKTFRASDFLTQEQMDEVKTSNLKGRKKLNYNEVDAYIAEILARFGYEAYVAWKFGEIDENNMAKYIQAERVREARNRLKIENIIVASVYGANNADIHGHAPKTLKTAIKMLKEEENLAKGAN